MPKRVQRSRAKGWRAPDGAVYVGRGTKWGNPVLVTVADNGKRNIEYPAGTIIRTDERRTCHQIAVDFYRRSIKTRFTTEQIRRELAGKDLMCWCALDQPCHADVLLEIANGEK